MQTLTHEGETFDYRGMIEDLENQFQMRFEGVDVRVKNHYDPHAVELIVGENSLMMTIDQARDLDKVFQKAITKVSRSYRKSKQKSK